MTDNIRSFAKVKIEEMLLRLGFEPAIVVFRLSDKYEEIECYKYSGLYCMITFTRHSNTQGEFKEWVLIEYADSLYHAEKNMFEDGDMIPLDMPIEQVVFELERELLDVIKKHPKI